MAGRIWYGGQAFEVANDYTADDFEKDWADQGANALAGFIEFPTAEGFIRLQAREDIPLAFENYARRRQTLPKSVR
jgi:hypothetical protein